jgi:hypothetical protein
MLKITAKIMQRYVAEVGMARESDKVVCERDA